jgi:hypothetical protein
MHRKFRDGDLKVDVSLKSDWIQEFVNKHGHERKAHGQMKLLCSNLLGLALVEQHLEKRQAKIQLVVAGASPGTHMLVLLRHVSRWMEQRNVRMTLYDPAPLDAELQQIVNDSNGIMQFEQRVFKDRDAEQWVREKGHDCLVFFSDIRSSIHRKNEHMSADEDLIAADMQAQKTWVELMQPDYCMLKFHAPHATRDKAQVDKSIRYLDGVLYEQAYVGLFSAEYRLFCRKADIGKAREYETAEIEGHAFFHTHHTRLGTYAVNRESMKYDDAFAAHVALKAQTLGLIADARELLYDAKRTLHVEPMHFNWHHARASRVGALLVCMRQIL